jgi:membrane-bound serine protease (ClpP class)
MTKYIALVLAGAALLAFEIFVPGGILGIIGFILLLLAAATAVKVYGGIIGYSLAIIAILIGCLMVYLVVRFFPSSYVGKKLSLPTDMKDSQTGDPESLQLIGIEGIALTILRPAGFALINEKRVDVVTRGENIIQGEKIRVVDVEGNRIIVEKV